jgi:hypothetical protein
MVAYASKAGAHKIQQDQTRLSVVDSFGMDLISQTAATTSSPAVIHLLIADGLRTADLRARLYAPVTTRDEMLTMPSTPLITEWVIEDARTISTDEGAVVSVPVQPPGEDLTSLLSKDARPLPLHLEMIDATGSVVAGLTTFLSRGAEGVVSEPAHGLTVAVILDLRLPPSHLADGGATVDESSLDRVLRIAEVLSERKDVPLSVVISSETLDALALIGDDISVERLRTALLGRQLLTTTWTSLDLTDWSLAVRLDVVLDGLRRGAEATRWAGLEASTVMPLEYPLTARAVRAVTEPAIGVSAFVVDSIPDDGGPLPPVASVVGANDARYPVAQVDSLLSAMLQFPDAELGFEMGRAELLRMASAGSPNSVVVSLSAFAEPRLDWLRFPNSRGPAALSVANIEPEALALLLEMVAADPALRLATVNEVLAQESPAGTISVGQADGFDDPGDFDLYLARRIQVEQRLEAYESFVGDDPFLVAPLRTLLAVSASELLTTGERTEFLDAVDQQLIQHTTGVEFLGRGPMTVTERSTELPVTLMNNRPDPVTVALELTSDTIDFTHGERSILTLEPGRNDLSVPVEVAASGRTSIRVTVTTPDEAGAIVLTTGTFSVRFADAEGVGFLILILAAAVLATWWLRTLSGRARDADSCSATVATPGSVSGDAETPSEAGTTPSTGDHEEMT